MTIEIGRIEALYRYPVKSMAGHRVEAASVGWQGIAGDRRLAFRRKEEQGGFPWLSAGKLADLLLFTPLSPAEEGALPTRVRTPDGQEMDLFGAALAEEIGRRHGAPVEMMRLNAGIFDEASISVITEETVREIFIRGSYQSYRKNDPIHLVQPGEFIIGYPDDRNNFPPEPELSPLADPDNRLPVADKSRSFGNTIVEAPRAVGRNGSFLVIRQLEQDVGAFWHYCRSEAERVAPRFPQPYDVTDEFVAAKLVGRWPDGSSLVRNPYYPFPKEQQKRQERREARATAAGFTAEGAAAATGEPAGDGTARPDTRPEDKQVIPPPAEPSHRGDNDFLYGVEDPQATRCPFGAHIRRANPRDSLMPGSMEQVSISNRHRLLRVGRLYQEADGRDPGLLFMCLNGDIERQFEFIQQTWLTSPAFHGLVGEQDPLTSDGRNGATGFIVPTHDGPVRLKPLKRFVRTLGGGYFFLPSRSLLAYLAGV